VPKKRSEPGSNVQLVCKDCAPRSTEAWKDVKPELLINCFVKKEFPAINPMSGTPSRETMWVRVTGVKRGKLVGTLVNYPAFEMELEFGDTVSVSMKDIIATLGPTGKSLDPENTKKTDKKYNQKGVSSGRKSRLQTDRA
jgi:hypothetical protein